MSFMDSEVAKDLSELQEQDSDDLALHTIA